MTVSKDGGDVDAITAATISSRAFLSAVNAAYAALNGSYVNTGATRQLQAEPEQTETVSTDAEQQVTNDFVSQGK